nr:MAG: DNA pilot protein [Microviridae sp.]
MGDVLSGLISAGASLYQTWQNSQNQISANAANAASVQSTNTANAANVAATNQSNQAMNAANNAQNMALTREGWARDDSSIQRRVADLQAAGLSPVLAAGQGAGNMAPIALKAAQNESFRADAPQVRPVNIDLMGNLSTAMALMSQKQQIDKSSAETVLTSETARKLTRENNINHMMDLLGSDRNPTGISGLAEIQMENILAERDKKQADAQNATSTSNINQKQSEWFDKHNIPGMIDNDTLQKLVQGSILGLNDKQGVLLGGATDVASKLVNTYSKIRGAR